MSTPHGTSPSASYLHQDAELYSLDFLGLSELDAPMSDVDSPKPAGLADSTRRNQEHGVDAGKHASQKSAVGDTLQGGSHRTGGQKMEVDEKAMTDGKQEFMFNGHEYDALQAAMLQQQLSSFHMQSPLGFDINNPPFHISQMLSSPAGQALQLQSGHNQQKHSQENAHTDGSRWHGADGTPVPGSTELTSPIDLELLSWQQQMEGKDSGHAPTISPALSQRTSHSAYDSPVSHAPHNPHGHRNSLSDLSTKSPLEQLQEQQAQFQEQLALLQQRQLEMQATAAAVMAAQSSPYMMGHGPSPSFRPSTTPGVAQSPGGIFSPLTSPALEATNRPHRSHSGHHNHHFSPAFNAQQQRTPHPLSTMSSPGLNPVGSSGGANQTLSPALNAQNSADMDPEYIRALVGMLDNGHAPPLGEPSQLPYQSPSMASTSTAGHTTVVSSPALQATISGTGPHRQSLPSKTRPSPMLKPTNHRSNHRNSGSGHYSVPSSPAVTTRYHPDASMPPAAMNTGLPPSALEHHRQVHSSTSTTSTPSPVDLSQIMPPPPVPLGTSKSRKGVLPMTPASLMNLGSGKGSEATDGGQNVPLLPPPRRPSSSSTGKEDGHPAAEASGSGQAASTGKGTKKQGGKKGSAGKPVPVGGKRALAARPQAVGVRVATKAAAAAAAALTIEPENRKISHKAAEQKRRDSLKAGFDELRLLLPPINTEALDPLSGEPIPGSSAPRLLPKSSLVPDDNPNRGVSKVALLRFGNEYIEKLQERVDRRDVFIEQLREEVDRLRRGGQEEVRGEDGEDLLDYDWREGEDHEFGDGKDIEEEGEEDEDQEEGLEDGMEVEGNGGGESKRPARTKSSGTKSPGAKPTRLSLSRSNGSDVTITRGKKGE
ncbi:hypothetical protein IAR50_001018 [Cryptococcus sp. DSM 104548]